VTIHPSHSKRRERETAALKALAQKFKQEITSIPLGVAGYVIRMAPDKRRRSVWNGGPETAPIIMSDVDDTLMGYNKARKPRLNAFIKYARELGLALTAEQLEAVMEMADAFARWKDWGIDADLYHVDAHMWALDWLTQQLRNVAPRDIPEQLKDLQAQLDAIKAGIGGMPDKKLPFSFDYDELVLGTLEPSPQMITVFEAVYEPELYEDTLEVLQEIAEAGGHTVIYTYGEPLFHLEKLLRLRSRLAADGQEWPFEYIFLARKQKGSFLEELFESAADNRQLHDMFFGRAPHIVLLMDDDKKQCDDFLRIADAIEPQSGARFCTVHLLRETGKTWKQRFDILREEEGSLVADRHERREVLLYGTVGKFHAHESDEVRNARIAAYANLRLRVYKALANNLTTVIERLQSTEYKLALESQRQYFAARVQDMEHAIAKAYGLSKQTL